MKTHRVKTPLCGLEPVGNHLSIWAGRITKNANTRRWRNRLVWARRIMLAAIIAYLFYRLTQIGWTDIAGHLPASPLFYLFSVAIFLTVPLSETLNYRLITGKRIANGLKIFSRKRVYNDALVSYTGEAYLVGKLANQPGFDQRRALIAVKDNNLVSALVSNSWAILLVAALFIFGKPDILQKLWDLSPVLIGGFVVICLIIYALVILFFRRLSALPPLKLVQVTAVHSGKVLVVAGLQVAQWASALPATPVLTWLMFLTVQTLVKRIPGLPNGDLVFLGVGLSLAGFAGGAALQVSAMLLAATAMTQLVQLAIFILTSKRP